MDLEYRGIPVCVSINESPHDIERVSREVKMECWQVKDVSIFYSGRVLCMINRAQKNAF